MACCTRGKASKTRTPQIPAENPNLWPYSHWAGTPFGEAGTPKTAGGLGGGGTLWSSLGGLGRILARDQRRCLYSDGEQWHLPERPGIRDGAGGRADHARDVRGGSTVHEEGAAGLGEERKEPFHRCIPSGNRGDRR